MQRTPYYAHSGRAPASGVAVAIAGGTIGASLLAAVYAYFDALIPFVYLNLIGAVVVGFVAGTVTGKLLVRGLVRNNRTAVVAGIAVGFLALYVAWAAWPGAILKRPGPEVGFVHLLASPPALWATITAINRHGAWKLSGSTPTGFILWIAWAGEAAIIVGTSLNVARSYVASEPFCEICQHWCALEGRVLETHGWDAAEFKRRLESKDFDYLASLGPRTANDVEWFRIDLHRCRGCGNTATLTAKRVEIVTENNRASEKPETVLEGLVVSGPEIDRLRHFRFDSPGPRAV